MNTTEMLNQILTQAIEADGILQLANDTSDRLINTNAIDYHAASALSNHLYKVELSINELILYLAGGVA
jgi:hypothetical protein